MSGSRKCILMLILVGMIYVILSSPKKTFKNIIIISALLICVFIAITEVPFLYDHIGYRFEGVLAQFTDESEVDKSTLLRNGMVEYGIEFFKKSPVWGYGINCYQDLYGSITGWKVYSHNNFIEMLVGTGIIGFLSYYLYPVVILFANKKNDKKEYFMKSFLIAMVILDYAMVSYLSPDIQITLCILITALGSNSSIRKVV